MKKYLFLPVCILLLSPFLVHANPLPKYFSAWYTVKKGAVEFGVTHRTLRPGENGTWVFESVTVPVGMFARLFKGKLLERSRWIYENGRIKPLEYIFKRTGLLKRQVTLTFDWQKIMVTNSINSDQWRMKIKTNTLDKLIYQLNIMHDLLMGKRTFDYSVADGGTLKTYHIVAQGEEWQQTPIGKFRTLRVIRLNDVRKTTLWCAPKLSYLPVRIAQIDADDGKLVVATLKALQGLPAKR